MNLSLATFSRSHHVGGSPFVNMLFPEGESCSEVCLALAPLCLLQMSVHFFLCSGPRIFNLLCPGIVNQQGA